AVRSTLANEKSVARPLLSLSATQSTAAEPSSTIAIETKDPSVPLQEPQTPETAGRVVRNVQASLQQVDDLQLTVRMELIDPQSGSVTEAEGHLLARLPELI